MPIAPVDVEVYQRFFERERLARKEAERLLETRSRELYDANQALQKTARALEKEVQRSKVVFETAAEGIIIFNDIGAIESLNAAAKQIFELHEVDCTQLNICQIVPSATFCEVSRTCITTLIQELASNDNELMGLRSDGTGVPIELIVSAFVHNGTRSYSAIVRDLTRRKELEARLAHAQKMESVGQLAAGIAHELNTPIQFVGDNTHFLRTTFESISEILDLTQTLLEHATEVESLQPLAKQIQETSDRVDLPFLRDEVPAAIEQTLEGAATLSRIVKAMKIFSHPGTADFQQVDLNHALESTLTVCRSEWKYCAELLTEFEPNLPKVSCLPGELNQAFLNLIVNAAHAICSKNAGTPLPLTVRTRSNGDLVVVEIQDSGIGIPEAIRSRIFDPFFTTKGVGKGTGQGLSLCYNTIVNIHRGKLYFDSEEGVGTTFYVEIPMRQQVNVEPEGEKA